MDFDTRSGRLTVRREADGRLAMDFPAQSWTDTAAPAGLAAALGVEPVAVKRAGTDYLVELKDAAAVAGLKPDLAALKAVECRCVAVTAPGTDGADFVSRVFGPCVGIDEDPVTGSTHCFLGPYWGQKLGKFSLLGRQLSARGGEMEVRLQGPRVLLLGWAVTVAQGEWLD
jgi:predicted PhzF superfamily epimerase YddE/YHI9